MNKEFPVDRWLRRNFTPPVAMIFVLVMAFLTVGSRFLRIL